MAAKRGRTITTFGSLFTPLGISGGVSGIIHPGRVVLSQARVADVSLADEAVGEVTLDNIPVAEVVLADRET